jgi:hypothetical protein
MKLYTSIKYLPLLNYFYIVNDNDHKQLIIDGVASDNILKQAWEDIRAEITDNNGVSDNQLTLLQKEKDIVLLKAELLLEKCEDNINQINMRIDDYNEFIKLNTSTSDTTCYDECAIIEKHFGFQFDLKSTTVERYLSYKKIFHKQLKQQANGRKSN